MIGITRFFAIVDMRFPQKLDRSLTLQQIRGLEGIRVREAYAQASKRTGVLWKGRSYERNRWEAADPVNRAISAGNACLYGLVHAAILSIGMSPALGFIHAGKQLSFVYDIADLYKTDLVVPLAFDVVRESDEHVERRMRHACRDMFHRARLLKRTIPDIRNALDIGGEDPCPLFSEPVDDNDPARPEPWWSPSERGEKIRLDGSDLTSKSGHGPQNRGQST